MKLFISHETALAYWREHFPLDSEVGAPAQVSAAEGCITRKQDVLASIPESWVIPNHPVDILAFEPSDRRQSKQVRCRTWSANIPEGAFFRDGAVHVSSPEFVFLQMAPQLSIAQLVALGCELCGTYILLPKGRQHPGAFDDHPRRVAPLTTVGKLQAFLDQVDGAKGARKARRAARYVAEGSRSPMETMTYLLLCLPPLLGGYGLPRATLNPSIPLDKKAQGIGRRFHAEGDICWVDDTLDIEYHGEVHVGAQKMQDDVGRILAIESMGWRVITITSPQVLDWERFEVVATEAASHLKRRLYPQALGATPARIELHEQLERWMFTD